MRLSRHGFCFRFFAGEKWRWLAGWKDGCKRQRGGRRKLDGDLGRFLKKEKEAETSGGREESCCEKESREKQDGREQLQLHNISPRMLAGAVRDALISDTVQNTRLAQNGSFVSRLVVRTPLGQPVSSTRPRPNSSTTNLSLPIDSPFVCYCSSFLGPWNPSDHTW